MLVGFNSQVVFLSLLRYFYVSKIYIKYNYTFFGYVCEDFCFHNCVIRHLNKCQLINFVKVQHYFLCGDCVLNKYVRMILFHGYQAKKTPTVETTNHFTLAFSHIFDFLFCVLNLRSNLWWKKLLYVAPEEYTQSDNYMFAFVCVRVPSKTEKHFAWIQLECMWEKLYIA